MVNGWREHLALWSPGLLAFVAMAIFSDVSWVAALALSALLPVLAIFGYIVCFVMLSRILGPERSAADPWHPLHHLAAGILLATAVWVWWQVDRQATQRAVVACVASASEWGHDQSVAELATTCFSDRGDDVRYH